MLDQDGVGGDTALLDAALAEPEARARMRVWQAPRQLVAPRRLVRLPAFAAAVEASTLRGWPVAVRLSGGTVVAHGSGIVNVSRVDVGAVGTVDAEAGYHALAAVLLDVLADWGIAADVGAVSRSHCDGRFSLRHAGRKLAGTAAVVRTRGLVTACLTHANILVEGDGATELAAIEALETSLGMPSAYDRQAHVSVAAILRGD